MAKVKSVKVKKPRVKKVKTPEQIINGYIFGALHKIWRWSKPRRECLAISKIFDSSRQGDWHTCAKCDGIFPKDGVQVDHINPVVDPSTGFVDWNTYIQRLLYISTKDLQTLCKSCHSSKSTEENSRR